MKATPTSKFDAAAAESFLNGRFSEARKTQKRNPNKMIMLEKSEQVIEPGKSQVFVSLFERLIAGGDGRSLEAMMSEANAKYAAEVAAKKAEEVTAEAAAAPTSTPGANIIDLLTRQQIQQREEAQRLQEAQAGFRETARQIEADRLAAEAAARKAAEDRLAAEAAARKAAEDRLAAEAAAKKAAEDRAATEEAAKKASMDKVALMAQRAADAVRSRRIKDAAKVTVLATMPETTVQTPMTILSRKSSVQQTTPAAEAEASRKAEAVRLAAEAEAARKAEAARLEAEAEVARKAEAARLAVEAEAARKAEAVRKASEEEMAEQRVKQIIALKRLAKKEEEERLRLEKARHEAEEEATAAYLALEAKKEETARHIEEQKKAAQIDIQISKLREGFRNLNSERLVLLAQEQKLTSELSNSNDSLESLAKNIKDAKGKQKENLNVKKQQLEGLVIKQVKRLKVCQAEISRRGERIEVLKQEIANLENEKGNRGPKPSDITVVEGLAAQNEMRVLRKRFDGGKKVVSKVEHTPVDIVTPGALHSVPAAAAATISPQAPTPSSEISRPMTRKEELLEVIEQLDCRITNCKEHLVKESSRTAELSDALTQLNEARIKAEAELAKINTEVDPNAKVVATTANTTEVGKKRRKKKAASSTAVAAPVSTGYLDQQDINQALDALITPNLTTKAFNRAKAALDAMIYDKSISMEKLILEIVDKVNAVTEPSPEMPEWKFFQVLVKNYAISKKLSYELLFATNGIYKPVMDIVQLDSIMSESIDNDKADQARVLMQGYGQQLAGHGILHDDEMLTLVEYAIAKKRSIETIKYLLDEDHTDLKSYAKALVYINDAEYMLKTFRVFENSNEDKAIDLKDETFEELFIALKFELPSYFASEKGLFISVKDSLFSCFTENRVADAYMHIELAVVRQGFQVLKTMFESLPDITEPTHIESAKKIIDLMFDYGFSGKFEQEDRSCNILSCALHSKNANKELVNYLLDKLVTANTLSGRYYTMYEDDIISQYPHGAGLLLHCMLGKNWNLIPLLREKGCVVTGEEVATAFAFGNFEVYKLVKEGDPELLIQLDKGIMTSEDYKPNLSLFDYALQSIENKTAVEYDIRIFDDILSMDVNKQSSYSRKGIDFLLDRLATCRVNSGCEEIFQRVKGQIECLGTRESLPAEVGVTHVQKQLARGTSTGSTRGR